MSNTEQTLRDGDSAAVVEALRELAHENPGWVAELSRMVSGMSDQRRLFVMSHVTVNKGAGVVRFESPAEREARHPLGPRTAVKSDN